MTHSNHARKTAYAANQHSVSIIGSDTGTAHIPKNFRNESEDHPEMVSGGDQIPRSPIKNISPFKKAKLEQTIDGENLAGLL